jgi:membrane fusion protein, adhesin transport system
MNTDNKAVKKTPATPSHEPHDLNINDAADWERLNQGWMKERAARVSAYADRYFMTDDELPLHRHMILVIIFAFFVLFIVWASFATLDETARGEGQIVPAGEVQVIQNLEGGIVDAFLAREGDSVKKDQIIMRLKDVGANSDLGANEARYLGSSLPLHGCKPKSMEKWHSNFLKRWLKKHRKA